MFAFIDELLKGILEGNVWGDVLGAIINFAIVLLIAIITYWIVTGLCVIVLRNLNLAKIHVLQTSVKKNKLVNEVSLFAAILMISALAFRLPEVSGFIRKLAFYFLVIMLGRIISSTINVINEYYQTKAISKKKPIKGLLQIAKVLLYMVLVLIVVASLIGQDPLVLIGGIGAFTAILSIVFKDALLGLVAGVQISSDSLLQIGDWVNIESEGVEGTVTDIALMSVKILGFDNTVYTVPTYTFLSVPFKNWHPVVKGGARRIVRTVYIDVNSMKSLGVSEVASYKKSHPESIYIDDIIATSKGVTNLTLYRADLISHIKADSRVCADRDVVVTIGETPSVNGLPIEMYFFTTETNWVNYTKVSSDMMELAIMLSRKHGITIFQKTNGV